MTHVTVVGTLAAEPELRFTNTGKAVASFSMAENHYRKNGDQYEQDGTTWWRVSVWDQMAENVAESNLSKGARVVVTGRSATRTYTAKDGTERASLEITADEVSPSLRFASVSVKPNPRESSGSGQRGAQRGRQQEPAASWDEPPF